MVQRYRVPRGWGTLLLGGALAITAGCASKDHSSSGDSGAKTSSEIPDGSQPVTGIDVGGAGDLGGARDVGNVTGDAGDAQIDAPVASPSLGDGGEAGAATRDGGCLPCPSTHQPACSAEVGPKAGCSVAGTACCDPGDHFWLCRCIPRADGGFSCTWMNACGS
jgi:hypothetical protein